MKVLAAYRQGLELGEDLPAERREFVRIVRAEIEGRAALLLREGVNSDGEDDDLARAARRVIEPRRIGVETGR